MIGLKALHTEPPPPPSRTRSAERAAAAGLLVLLLHALVFWIILESFYRPSSEALHYHETAITLWLTKPKIRARSAPVPVLRPKKRKQPTPTESYPVPNAEGFAVPPPPQTAPLSGEDYNGLRALGEYLYNCSEMNYGYLSPLDRLHCQFNLWNLPPLNPGKGLRLGKPPNSIWEQERQKQKAPPRKFTRPCRPNSPNSHLGLPCYNLAH